MFMITTAFPYVSVLLFIAGSLALVEEKTRWKLFNYLPAIVLLYFTVMLLSTLGLWSKTSEINQAYSSLKGNILPAMIFLMLLDADLRQIKRLGSKMLLAFFAAALSIGFAFIIGFALFKGFLAPDAWKTLAALSGSWMGGTGNMAAVQAALNVPDSSMGYTLLIDSIDYAMWVMFLLALVPLAGRFNKWTKADGKALEEVSANLASKQGQYSGNKTTSMLILLSGAMLVSVACQTLADILPVSEFFTKTAWTVMLVTILGVICAVTPISKMWGGKELSSLMLYLIIGLIASRANFNELTQAPIYIVLGMFILLIHGVLMLLVAKVFKLDLFTCGIASLANIGGVASAPILAAAYSRALIPVGVLMALLGYIVGTGGGLLVGRVLAWLSAA
ncbi:DUF819 domain-containing protein [Paraglaciecola sp. L1A13]|uniref:DUF819 family protein n=1 Tax=Paraglaciecola sp. L1A13 TaxID=2686359 RepID=UPI001E33DFC2|nr:DUF819 family protein [Paraglaciecola sp. L1A13]